MGLFGSDSYKPMFADPPLAHRPWSYSQYATFQTCRLAVRFKYVDKKAEAPRAASDRGTKIHDLCEQHVKSKGVVGGVPDVWRPSFQRLIDVGANAELKLGVDRDWRLVDWFDPKIWIRAKLDAHFAVRAIANVIDYKTGRVYPDHPFQADLYSVMAFSLAPKLKLARSEMWYLDQGPDATIKAEVKANEVKARRMHWVKAVEPMLQEKDFPAMPGRHCSWCGYSQKKGGPCTAG